MRRMRNKKRVSFIVLNIGIPLLIGGLLYYLFSPDVLFVRWLDSFLPIHFHASLESIPLSLKVLRNYAFDILWAYSLTVAMLCIELPFFSSMRNLILFIFVLEAVMETLQLMPCINGTFDVYDIAAEAITGILVIKIFYEKERGYEKE